MPRARHQLMPLAIAGGWNTEIGPSAPHFADPNGVVQVSHLINCENAILSRDGWPRKMPGAARVNTATTGATDAVMGIFDYWRSTAAGSPIQRRVIYSGTQIYSEDGSGTLTSIASGRQSATMPWAEIMNDVLVLAETGTTDVPASWNQTTFANLGGSPPNFSFHVQHKDRMWAGGVDSNKSRLYYSALSNQADWTGAGSGSIDIAPDDGDQGTGLASHRNQLVVFKGPQRGRIVRITGSAPTGSDAFAQVPFVTGVGATNQQAILKVSSDLWFVDHYGIHSLDATQQFGDYNERFLSRDIATYWIKELSHNRFPQIWGANFASAGYALWTVSRAGSSTHNLVIGLDYRFTPPRFFSWPAPAWASLGMILDTNQETVPWAGTYTGFVVRTNRAARNLENSAYTYKMTLPYLGFGDPFIDKTAIKARVGYTPKSSAASSAMTLGWTRDANTQQTATITQTGTATLGASSDQFTLDTSTLGGGQYAHQYQDLEGMFKELQLELSQGTLDVDAEPHSLAVIVEPAGIGETATLG